MPSEAVDVDRGQFVGRRLSHVAFVVDLHELSPVGRWATGRRDGRWFERFAEICQGLTSRGRSHPGLRSLANLRFEVSRLLPAVYCQPDIATTPRALQRKLLPHAGHEFGLWRREVSWEGGLSRKSQQSPVASPSAACPPTACPPVAASRGLPTFPFVMRRDGGPELVIRGEHPVIAMPVLPRRRHEVSEPVEELKWGKLDDADGARPRGLPPAPRADPVGGLVLAEHVADAGDATEKRHASRRAALA